MKTRSSSSRIRSTFAACAKNCSIRRSSITRISCNQRSHDPQASAGNWRHAYFRVGEITQDIGSRVEAIAAFQRAQSIWEALAVADGGNPELQGRVVDCCLAIGKQKGADGDLKGGLMALTRRGPSSRLSPRGLSTRSLSSLGWRIVTRRSGPSRDGSNPAIMASPAWRKLGRSSRRSSPDIRDRSVIDAGWSRSSMCWDSYTTRGSTMPPPSGVLKR